MTASVYDEHWPKLAKLGYLPRPTIPGTKVCGVYVPSLKQYRKMIGWQNPNMPIEESPQPGAGISVVLGKQPCGIYLVAIDWDDDEAALASIDKFPTTVEKQGKRGWTSFYQSRCR